MLKSFFTFRVFSFSAACSSMGFYILDKPSAQRLAAVEPIYARNARKHKRKLEPYPFLHRFIGFLISI
jgi:hypothetical protein